MTPVAALWTSTSSGPSAATSSSTRADVTLPADEHRLGAERAQLLGRLLGGPVVAQVADRDARRAVAGEAKRDRAADPARAARDEDVHARARQRVVGRRRRRELVPPEPRRRLARALVGLRRGVAEPVEPLHLLLGVPAHVVVGRQPVDELAHARPELVGEVRRRRPDEGVDVVAGRVALHRRERLARVDRGARTHRRPDAVRHRPPLGAQHDGHALRPDARVPAARLRDDPLRRRHFALHRLHLLARAELPDRAARPAATSRSPRR